MAWGTTVPDPPIPPAVPGWFAVFNLLARQFISLTNAAQVIGFVSALQTTPITNALVATGIQQGDQNFTLVNDGNAAVSPTVTQDFSVTESALLIGVPAANNPLLISGISSVVGLVLSPQQFNVLNQGTITGSEAIVTAPQFVPISDAATIKGIQAGGQSFTVVSGASWYGKPGMDQVVAITESGTVKGISAAAVNFTVTNTGAVYARLTGAQSFTLNNAPSSFYGKPTAAESFAIANAATVITGTAPKPTIVGTPNTSVTSSVTIPPHAIGQLIAIFAYNSNVATAPGKPASSSTIPNWNMIDNLAGLNANASATAYFVASVTNHTSGIWNNTQAMIAVVVDGQAASPIGGHAEGGATAPNGSTAPAIALTHADGSSLELNFFGRRSGAGFSAWNAAPAGYTQRAAFVSGTGICLDTKDDTTSDGAVTNGTDGSSNVGYRGATVEILSY